MPLVSSRESVRRGRVSALAIVETIAASGVSFWFAWKHDSVEHIAIASTLAPFLLLRTRLSTWYTIRVLSSLSGGIFSTNRRNLEGDTAGGIRFLAVFVLQPIIRIICTIRVFLRHPLVSIQMIPSNFYRNLFVTDFFFSPQVMPGSDEIAGQVLNELNAYRLIKILCKPEGIIDAIVGIILIVPLLVVAFSYRVAIKSTALIWLPLLWIIYQSQLGIKILDRIKVNTKQPWTKLMLVYSIFVVLAFGLKMASIFGVWTLTGAAWLGSLGDLAKGLVAPPKNPALAGRERA